MLTKRDIEARMLRASKDLPPDVHPLDLSDFYKEYVTQGIKPARIAEVVGKSRSYVGNILRLQNLCQSGMDDFYDGLFSVSVAIEALKHANDDGELAYTYLNKALTNAGSDGVTIRHLPKYKQRPQERLVDLVLQFVARHDNDLLGRDGVKAFVNEAKKIVVEPQVKRNITTRRETPTPSKPPRRGIPS